MDGTARTVETGRLDDQDAAEQAEELAWACAARAERSAFAPLYDRYAERIYRYCFRRLGDRDGAEEATSRTFEKALAGIDRFTSGSFRAWIFTIADRVVSDCYRRRRPHVELTQAAHLADAGLGPEGSVIAAEARQSVQQALTRLTPDQQRVVTLRLAGLTGAEIAAVLGVQPGTVRGLQFRAYQRLRGLLGEEA